VDYAVYRASAGGSWERTGSTAGVPSYSDKPPRSGEVYRYAVAARDAAGNESDKSEAVQVTAP